jgi:transposase
VPWAAPRSRFTLLCERLAIDVVRQCDVRAAMRILRISWHEACDGRSHGDEPVSRRERCGGSVSMKRRVATGHRYLTRVCDLDEGTVEHIAEDRTQASLDSYDAGLTQEPLDGLDAVVMDMGEPYGQATRARVQEANEKIVFDRFHVMRHISNAVDTVRKQEHRALMASGDETRKGSTYVWLYSLENVPERRREEIRRTAAPGTQGGSGVGDQRGLAVSLALRRSRLRLEVLETMVLLGDAQPAGTDAQGSGDSSPAHQEHSALLPASGHQRDE